MTTFITDHKPDCHVCTRGLWRPVLDVATTHWATTDELADAWQTMESRLAAGDTPEQAIRYALHALLLNIEEAAR